jgi:hypothetical protein
MRINALAIAAAIFASSVSGCSQAVEIGPRGVEVEDLQLGRSAARAHCRELRRACLRTPPPWRLKFLRLKGFLVKKPFMWRLPHKASGGKLGG